MIQGKEQGGHSLTLFIERACTNVRKESFSLRVTGLWNDLPEVVVTATSVNSFKNRLDRLWSTEEFLYNYKAALPGSRRAFQGKFKIGPPRPPPTVRKNLSKPK